MKKAELLQTIKRITGAAVFFLLLMVIISAVQKKKNNQSADVQIEIQELPGGNNLITPDDINLTIERSFGYQLQGIPLGNIDVGRLERVLEADPFIYEADAFVDARNKINIYVSQRVPLLRIIDKNGLDYYLDKEGIKMPLSKHFSARVLVATGSIPPYVPDFLSRKKHTLHNLFELANIILKEDFLTALIEQIYVGDTGEVTLIPKITRQKILFGGFEDMEDKFFRLKTFMQEGLPYEGWQKYKSINLKYRGQVVCEKK